MLEQRRSNVRSRLVPGLTVVLALALGLTAIGWLGVPADTLAAKPVAPRVTTADKIAVCGANARGRPTMAGGVVGGVRRGDRITVSGSVIGTSWRVACGGRIVAGRRWYRVTVVRGRSVSARFGVRVAYVAAGLFRTAPPLPKPRLAAPPAPEAPVAVIRVAACGANLRSSPRMLAGVRAPARRGTVVTVAATTRGGHWRVRCGRRILSGRTWLRITAVNGTPVKGGHPVYAAAGLFRAAPTPLGGTGKIEGVDVSHYQGTVNWHQVRAGGKIFAFIKASESDGFVDKMYEANRARARAAGLRVGAYHFARPDKSKRDAIREADHFIRTAKLARGDMLPVLDIEVSGGLSAKKLHDWVIAFVTRVRQKTGVRTLVYASPAFWRDHVGDSRWLAASGYAVLWIAHWTKSTEPWIPAAKWSGRGWSFWQYTSKGKVKGITGRVDLDRFSGPHLSAVLIR